MYSIIISSSLAVDIDIDTWKNIIEAIKRDDRVFILNDTGEAISLRPAPHIILTARFDSAKKKSLAARGLFECGYGDVHKFQDGCHCSSSGKSLEKFKISEDLREIIGLKKFGKSMPEPSYEDKLISRSQSGDRRATGILKGKFNQNRL